MRIFYILLLFISFLVLTQAISMFHLSTTAVEAITKATPCVCLSLVGFHDKSPIANDEHAFASLEKWYQFYDLSAQALESL